MNGDCTLTTKVNSIQSKSKRSPKISQVTPSQKTILRAIYTH